LKRVVVVSDGPVHLETAQGALAAAGWEAVTVAVVSEARAQLESGALAVVVAVPGLEGAGERLGPVLASPATVRRGYVVAAVGPGLRSSDGRQAFALGVDLTVGPGDVARLGELISVAVATKRALVAPLDPLAAARLGG